MLAARRPAEHFVYDGAEHVCVAAPHILHVFSFSKAFGMMGWRAPRGRAPSPCTSPLLRHLCGPPGWLTGVPALVGLTADMVAAC